MSIFTLLALTGFPQKFYDAGGRSDRERCSAASKRLRFMHRDVRRGVRPLSMLHVVTVGFKVAIGRARPTLVPEPEGLQRRRADRSATTSGSRTSTPRSIASTTGRSSSTGGCCSAACSWWSPGSSCTSRSSRCRAASRRVRARRQGGAQQRGPDGVPRRHHLAHLQRAPAPGHLPVRHEHLHGQDQPRAHASTSTRSSSRAWNTPAKRRRHARMAERGRARFAESVQGFPVSVSGPATSPTIHPGGALGIRTRMMLLVGVGRAPVDRGPRLDCAREPRRADAATACRAAIARATTADAGGARGSGRHRDAIKRERGAGVRPGGRQSAAGGEALHSARLRARVFDVVALIAPRRVGRCGGWRRADPASATMTAMPEAADRRAPRAPDRVGGAGDRGQARARVLRART